MISLLRATAILGSSSVATIAAGLVSAKAFALLIGPAGLGYLGLLQGLVGLAGLVASMGISTGLVRMGAEALERQDALKVAALRQASWWLFWLFASCTALILVLFRLPLSRLMLGGPEHKAAVAWMGLALLLTTASGVYMGLLNAHHRVAALAKVGLVNSVLSTGVAIGAVLALGERGIVVAVISMAGVTWVVTTVFLKWEVVPAVKRASLSETWTAANSLLHFGAPYTLSLIVGTGVQFVVPVLVLNTLGQASVGFYRAAITVSITYLGFLLSAMALDYFPRVSAASGDSQRLEILINQQHRLVMLLGVPLILGMLALAPLLVPLVYSLEFVSAVGIIEWQLVGDIFKLSSWTMSFVVLARSGSLIFFLAEAGSGVTYLLTSWLGMKWFGLVGLGLGHLVSYAVYLAIVWLIVRKEIGFTWSVANKSMLAVALLAALFIQTLPVLGLAGLRLPIALAVALSVGVCSLYILWREARREHPLRSSNL